MTAPAYLDTSAAVPAFIRERHTDAVLEWLGGQPLGGVAISGWVSVEFASAAAMKLRAGAIDPETHAAVTAAWNRFADGEAEIVALDSPDFDQAASLCRQPDLGLRAGDALHLALVRRRGLRLLTFDTALAGAAAALDVPLVRL